MPSDRQYELIYIVAPTATDAEVEGLQTEIGELVQKLGGSVEKIDVWGRRKLAYEIERHTEGIYVVQVLEGPGEMISELDRRLRVRDQVLRHLTVRVDESLGKAKRAADKRKATMQRRRAARGKPPLPERPESSADGATPAADAGAGDAAEPAAAAPADTPATGAEPTGAPAETSEVQE